MSERTTLHDDSPMPFGKHKGMRLGDIPDSYWMWFLDQTWSSQWPDLVSYAKCCEE